MEWPVRNDHTHLGALVSLAYRGTDSSRRKVAEGRIRLRQYASLGQPDGVGSNMCFYLGIPNNSQLETSQQNILWGYISKAQQSRSAITDMWRMRLQSCLLCGHILPDFLSSATQAGHHPLETEKVLQYLYIFSKTNKVDQNDLTLPNPLSQQNKLISYMQCSFYSLTGFLTSFRGIRLRSCQLTCHYRGRDGSQIGPETPSLQ